MSIKTAVSSAALLAGLLASNVSLAQTDSRSFQVSAGADSTMFEQIQQLRREVMDLRGIIEQQGNEIYKLKQQSMDRYIELDRRIGSLGTAATSEPDAGLSGEAIASANTAGTTGEDLAVNRNTANPGTGNASSDYARAYALVGARDYPKAIEAFKQYVKDYPTGDYTPNAWYWLGELYVAVQPQELDSAVQAFQRLLTEYPDNHKVPAAMYKLATVYFTQGDKQRAQDMLTHVIDRYGNSGSSAVKKSREFLRKNF
ncbi:tol-pal system protein YbgF [Spongiibacter sp. KMU-158]|uniref:Cell division coordinator CpoB n=1 Tax=Spongiibacter pelagi TaxID=2760804 RepID=A0A927C4W6_9GAMM|nr:tol-pal system protein YbgF [Spongiibacter pelagi]MBD2859806.1 tol-pal system protein YbgF [Spongiibacter pelagi]